MPPSRWKPARAMSPLLSNISSDSRPSEPTPLLGSNSARPNKHQCTLTNPLHNAPRRRNDRSPSRSALCIHAHFVRSSGKSLRNRANLRGHDCLTPPRRTFQDASTSGGTNECFQEYPQLTLPLCCRSIRSISCQSTWTAGGYTFGEQQQRTGGWPLHGRVSTSHPGLPH